jgi:hypothetical protein
MYIKNTYRPAPQDQSSPRAFPIVNSSLFAFDAPTDVAAQITAADFRTATGLEKIELHRDPDRPTFKASGSRKARDATHWRSVWVDCDLPFDDALEALKSSIDRGLPSPSVIVSSGGGAHAYFAFTRDLSLDEWEHAADLLQRACETYGFEIDSKCTTDAVRILRPPQTLNHKFDPPRRTEVAEYGPDYEYEDFIKELEVVAGVPVLSPSTEIGHRNGPARSEAAAKNRAIEIPYTGPPADPDLIAERCANIRHFRETGCAAEGEEPLWKASIGVLGFADGGKEKAHEWSRKDRRYDQSETERKIDARLANQSGASCCSQFENETDKASKLRCEECQFKGKIRSPIALGSVPTAPSPRVDQSVSDEPLPLFPPLCDSETYG